MQGDYKPEQTAEWHAGRAEYFLDTTEGDPTDKNVAQAQAHATLALVLAELRHTRYTQSTGPR